VDFLDIISKVDNIAIIICLVFLWKEYNRNNKLTDKITEALVSQAKYNQILIAMIKDLKN
jgi:hypothetical protein